MKELTNEELEELLVPIRKYVPRELRGTPDILDDLREALNYAWFIYFDPEKMFVNARHVSTNKETASVYSTARKLQLQLSAISVDNRVLETNKCNTSGDEGSGFESSVVPSMEAREKIFELQESLEEVVPLLKEASAEQVDKWLYAHNRSAKQEYRNMAVGVLIEFLKSSIPECPTALWHKSTEISPAATFIHLALNTIGIKVGERTIAELSKEETYLPY